MSTIDNKSEAVAGKHTPGPWIVEEDVYAGGVRHLAVTNRSAGADWMPCSVTPMDTARDLDWGNARLIAASPDLLDACKEAVTELGEFIADCIEDANEFDYRVVRILEAAIAKAEGRAS